MNETRVARNEFDDVLDHLGRPKVGQDAVAREAVVQRGHGRGVLRRARPDDDPVGGEEVVDGGPLLQELRVADDPRRLLPVGQRAEEQALDRLAGADGRGALVHDDRRAPVERRRDRAGGRPDVAKVRRTGQRGRRIDGEEDELRFGDGVVVRGREAQPTVGQALRDQFGQPSLADGHLATAQQVDEVCAAVHTDDAMTELGEAGGHDETDMTTPDDGDLRRHHRPSARITAGMVATMTRKSSHSDQRSMYSRSFSTHRSKLVSLRPPICQSPVIPGRIDRRRRCQSS